jgi:hypothetical protein
MWNRNLNAPPALSFFVSFEEVVSKYSKFSHAAEKMRAPKTGLEQSGRDSQRCGNLSYPKQFVRSVSSVNSRYQMKQNAGIQTSAWPVVTSANFVTTLSRGL